MSKKQSKKITIKRLRGIISTRRLTELDKLFIELAHTTHKITQSFVKAINIIDRARKRGEDPSTWIV